MGRRKLSERLDKEADSLQGRTASSPDTAAQAFLLGDFLLDRRGGGLFRMGKNGETAPVAIGARALDLLCALVERHGDLVTKQEIMDAVWPSTTVEEVNLTVQVSALRRVLDHDRTHGSCIQTVPGRGYRLVVPVARRDGSASRSQPAIGYPAGMSRSPRPPHPTGFTTDHLSRSLHFIISAAIRNRSISPTASPTTSSPSYRGIVP